MKARKVFLGGTCNGSTWRDELIALLHIDYFNPVVEDWTPACMQEELRQRDQCAFCLYVITPRMTGVYAIAEVVDDSNKRPRKTIFVPLHDYDGDFFDYRQWKSICSVAEMVKNNGGIVLGTLLEVAKFLNEGE